MKWLSSRLFIILIGIMVLLTTGWGPWVSSGSAARLAQQADAPVTDLVADFIEITQSIQDLNNSVPLVEGKRTFVRVYAHSTNNIYPTTATLTLASGALTQTLLPIAPGGPMINVRPSYNRLVPGHAFLFELPLWATFVDNLTLTAQINPSLRWRARDPEESNYANNTLIKSVSFDFVPKLNLVIADQPYTLNATTYTVRPYDRWKATEWLSRVYPLSQVKVYYRTLPTVQATRKMDKNKNWDLTFPYCEWVDLYLAVNRYAIFGNPFLPKDAAFLGIVPDDMGFMRGCAYIGGMITANGFARTAAAPVGAGDWGWDFDGSYADWYSAHELGHAFGRPHVRGGPGYVKDGCGGEAKSVTHNLNGRISPTTNIFDPAAIFGFDSLHLVQGTNPILGPTWSDVMTYCDYEWMSKATYVKLKETFEAALPLAAVPTPRPVVPQSVLAVFGALDLNTGEVKMLPISVLSSVEPITPPAPGIYAIVLRGAGGDELARYPFTPEGLLDGASPYEGVENKSAYISELVPYTPEIASLEIESPTGVIFQMQAGLNLPAVQITAPNGGEVFGTGSITVSWTASDADDDPLTFNIDYSPDNGNSWEPVALFITDTQVTIDPLNLPTSDMGLFRVSASDGLHTTSDTSDGFFFIPNHLPQGEIILPAADTTIALDQTITFQGQVYDNDLGLLDEGSLQWVSDRDGLLGNGAIFNTASLSVGLHEINLVADDGHGQTVIGQVIVTVVSTPNDLPPQSNALSAGPDLVFLYPNAGIPSGKIYLDNLNLGGNLPWNVTSSEAWMALSASSGTTPVELTVSTTLASRDFGTHKALLTFSDPGGVYPPVYIVVKVSIPEYQLFLPSVGR